MFSTKVNRRIYSESSAVNKHISFLSDGNVLELDSGKLAQFCEYIKKPLNFTLKWCILWYVSCISVKLLFKNVFTLVTAFFGSS